MSSYRQKILLQAWGRIRELEAAIEFVLETISDCETIGSVERYGSRIEAGIETGCGSSGQDSGIYSSEYSEELW